MTEREFLTAILAVENLSEELADYAKAKLEKLDEKNAARRAKPTKVQAENEPLYAKVLELLNADEPTLSTTVAAALEVSTSKATGLLGNLYNDGKVVKVDVTVKGKGKQKGWLIAS